MHRHCLTDWPTDSGLFLHRMQYLKSRKQIREAKRKESQKERVQVRQQSKVLLSLEEEALANARAFDRYDSMLTAKVCDRYDSMRYTARHTASECVWEFRSS